MARLLDQNQRQARRLEELETRVALLEAEARKHRARAAGKLAQTVTIGRSRSAASVSERAGRDGRHAEQAEGAPVKLRLRGRRVVSSRAKPLPAVPSVSERLPVVPLPGERNGARASNQSAPEATTQSPRAAYRRGLGLLRDREYDGAVAAFAAFVGAHPEHALAPSAIYWKGEAQYAKRDYEGAREAFAQVLARFPSSQKAPGALYKLGLCHQRLGDQAGARRSFERLRAEFPDSEAAKRASVEGSS